MSLVTVTVADIQYKAFRYAGILRGPMRGLSGSEQAESTMILNSMLDAYRADRAWIYAISRTIVPINANQQEYTIGQDVSGGVPDWQMERPETIERAGFLYTNTNPVIEVAFETYTEQQWAALSPKDLTSTIPYILYYRPLVPNGLVSIWPVPTENWAAALYLWQTLTQIAGPDDILQMPPAYDDALSYGLAVRLAPLYKESLMFTNPNAFGEVSRQAAAAKQRIRTINFPTLLMQCGYDSMGVQSNGNYGSRYNILANNYNS